MMVVNAHSRFDRRAALAVQVTGLPGGGERPGESLSAFSQIEETRALTRLSKFHRAVTILIGVFIVSGLRLHLPSLMTSFCKPYRRSCLRLQLFGGRG